MGEALKQKPLTDMQRQQAVEAMATISALDDHVTRGKPIAFDAVTRERISWAHRYVQELRAENADLRARAGKLDANRAVEFITSLTANIRGLLAASAPKPGKEEHYEVYRRQSVAVVDKAEAFARAEEVT